MAFMRPDISREKERFLISDDLEEVVFCKYNQVFLQPGTYSADDLPEDEDLAADVLDVCKELGVTEFEIVSKYWGYLSAPGYLDRSDYILGDSIQDVAKQLLDMYFDGDPEYMDEAEKEDMAWLESVEKEGA
jgi:hypothetical protein